MSITKRENGRYRARYRDAAGKEHARHFKLKGDAKAWLDEVTASVVRGDYVDPKAGKITFRQWFTEWSEVKTWAAGTAETAAMVLESVSFADMPMSKINELHIEKWMKSMTQAGPSRKTGLASSTRKTRFNYVRMAFLAAVKVKVIRDDPTSDVSAPKVGKGELKMTIPTAEQVGAALGAAPEGFRPFVAVCAFAGLRLGEAAGLQVSDVNFLKRTLVVHRQVQGRTADGATVVAPKCESSRPIYLPDGLVAILAAHVEQGLLGDEGWLFHWHGRLFNRNSAATQWRNLRSQVGMESFTLHDLRHFYASGLIASGCDVVTVQHALGHSKSSITLDTYSHLWPRADDRTRTAAANLMDSALADSVRTAANI